MPEHRGRLDDDARIGYHELNVAVMSIDNAQLREAIQQLRLSAEAHRNTAEAS